MDRKLSGAQVAMLSIIIPCTLGWAWHLESKSEKNTLKIENVKEDIEDVRGDIESLRSSFSKMDEKLDKKSASDNANFLLVLQHISDLKVENAKNR